MRTVTRNSAASLHFSAISHRAHPWQHKTRSASGDTRLHAEGRGGRTPGAAGGDRNGDDHSPGGIAAAAARAPVTREIRDRERLFAAVHTRWVRARSRGPHLWASRRTARQASTRDRRGLPVPHVLQESTFMTGTGFGGNADRGPDTPLPARGGRALKAPRGTSDAPERAPRGRDSSNGPETTAYRGRRAAGRGRSGLDRSALRRCATRRRAPPSPLRRDRRCRCGA